MQIERRSGIDLAKVLEDLARLVRQLATAGNLSMTAASVLGRLMRDGPQRLTELANGEGVSQPGMTQLVTRLERDGFVRRTASSDDRRGVLVEVTDTGAELVARRRAQRAEALRHLLSLLDPDDQAAINAALPALTRFVETRTASE
jgi:DNA-binding MarR family transcriptional regulator